jgi:hypothetical protein
VDFAWRLAATLAIGINLVAPAVQRDVAPRRNYLACEFPRENSQDRAWIPLLQSNLYHTKGRCVSSRDKTNLSRSGNSTENDDGEANFVGVSSFIYRSSKNGGSFR